ncbi:MAG TPA: hypothetical protein VIG80_08170 [Bacillaceae bacterium]
MIGIWAIILSFVLVGAAIWWGISYTRKNIHTDKTVRLRAAGILFTIAFILSAGYIYGSNRWTDNIDIIISWMILSMGFMFSAAIAFFVGFFYEKK